MHNCIPYVCGHSGIQCLDCQAWFFNIIMENLLTTNGEAFISSYAHMCRHRSELLIQGLDDIRWVKGIGISVSPVWIKTAPAKLQITLKIWFTNFNKCHAFDFLCHPSFYGTQIAHIAPCPKWSLRGGGGLHHPPPPGAAKASGCHSNQSTIHYQTRNSNIILSTIYHHH